MDLCATDPLARDMVLDTPRRVRGTYAPLKIESSEMPGVSGDAHRLWGEPTLRTSAAQRSLRISSSRGFTTNDWDRRHALDRILNGTFDDLDHSRDDDCDFACAMKLLLKHVRIDPDGGLSNLDDKETNQHSKISALQKTTLGKGLAMFALFRSVGNPCLVVYFAVRMLHGYYFQQDWIDKLESTTKDMRLPLPVMECCLITALAELCSILFLLFQALRHGLEASCWSDEAAHDHLHPRYIAMATFYWNDLPYLQSFSALAPLAFIHPNMLTKNLKAFSLVEDVARAKLKKFLPANDRAWDDDTIIKKVVGAIVNYDYKEDKSDEKKDIATEYLDARPRDVLQLLQKSELAKNPSSLEEMGFNHAAIFGGRFGFYCWVERLVFFVGAWLALLAGTIGFTTKLARCSCLLMDQEVHWFMPLASLLAFINQSMGIMSISKLLMWRIQVFLFGGSDVYVSSEEKFIMRVYLGSLASAVWKSEILTWFEKMCVMFEFDDDDLQHLVIEDDTRAKARLISQVRTYMQKTHAINWVKEELVEYSM